MAIFNFIAFPSFLLKTITFFEVIKDGSFHSHFFKLIEFNFIVVS